MFAFICFFLGTFGNLGPLLHEKLAKTQETRQCGTSGDTIDRSRRLVDSRLGRKQPKCGRDRLDFGIELDGQIWPLSAVRRSKLAKFHQHQPNLADRPAQIGQTQANAMVSSGPSFAELVKFRPSFVRMRPKMARIGPTFTRIDQIGQMLAFVANWLADVGIRPNQADSA